MEDSSDLEKAFGLSTPKQVNPRQIWSKAIEPMRKVKDFLAGNLDYNRTHTPLTDESTLEHSNTPIGNFLKNDEFSAKKQAK